LTRATPRPAEESRVSLFEVRESLSCLRDNDRIEMRPFETTGNLGLAQRQIERMLQATCKLAEFSFGAGQVRSRIWYLDAHYRQ
jgi:hypothetical protein